MPDISFGSPIAIEATMELLSRGKYFLPNTLKHRFALGYKESQLIGVMISST